MARIGKHIGRLKQRKMTVIVSLITLASFLKVQRYGFFGGSKGTPPRRRVPWLMQTAMVLLALLCVAMAFLIVSGWDRPAVIQPGVDALQRGALRLIIAG